MYNSDHCKEDFLTLKHQFSMREFMAYRENISILEFYDAANTLDEVREYNKIKNSNK